VGETILRRIHGERVLLAGGQRSLVMQLAHPLVAAAVADHSDFPARAMERLDRTLDLTLSLVHGSPKKADEAAAHIRAVHRRVIGVTETGGTRRPYRAGDPRLLLWVHATVVDTTMLVYRHFVGPLSAREERTYYEAMKQPARLLGVPDRVLPPDLSSFRRYMQEMVDGQELHATNASRSLVASVLRPPVRMSLRPATEAGRLVTLALLPERIRQHFELEAGLSARLALASMSRASRAILRLLPAAVRTFPQARNAGPLDDGKGENTPDRRGGSAQR
jgi:uncharacterized protein (DUF2236 family)